jgi:hypothetical protein
MSPLPTLNMEVLEILKAAQRRSVAVPDGTFPPGARVRKSKMRRGDAHDVGALATTVAVPLGPVEHEGREVYCYLVEWDDTPGLACFVAGEVLELVRST